MSCVPDTISVLLARGAGQEYSAASGGFSVKLGIWLRLPFVLGDVIPGVNTTRVAFSIL